MPQEKWEKWTVNEATSENRQFRKWIIPEIYAIFIPLDEDKSVFPRTPFIYIYTWQSTILSSANVN